MQLKHRSQRVPVALTRAHKMLPPAYGACTARMQTCAAYAVVILRCTPSTAPSESRGITPPAANHASRRMASRGRCCLHLAALFRPKHEVEAPSEKLTGDHDRTKRGTSVR
mmetsp:Transcript_13288/g.28849  ORF Transcript_13288/g.28849 Transcript_13288/m.28849 type:complete len:111 (-) Transcript_13288:19-351(-)